LPSLNEAAGMVLIEAQAAGVPVVATRVGGIPEVVQDGITGILVPPKDPGALARAIRVLLQDKEMRMLMGSCGRERVRGRFSREGMGRQTEGLYRELLANKTIEV